MRKLFLLLFTISSSLLLINCGSSGNLTSESFAQVKLGMTVAEVEALIGKPTEQKEKEVAGIKNVTYVYKQEDSTALVAFNNGKVVGRSGFVR